MNAAAAARISLSDTEAGGRRISLRRSASISAKQESGGTRSPQPKSGIALGGALVQQAPITAHAAGIRHEHARLPGDLRTVVIGGRAQVQRFPRARLDQLHAQFMEEVIEPALRPAARALLQQHQDNGDLVAIVTATNRFVTEPIASALGVEHLIAALPQQDAHGEITGQLLGTPTHGAGKVSHTHAWLATMGKTLGDFERSHFYSDSHNDLPLMSVVTDPVATNPNAVLTAHATRHGWPILHLFND